jgi:flagellar motor switch protein FliG
MSMKDRVDRAYKAGKGAASGPGKESPDSPSAAGGQRRPIRPPEESFPPDPEPKRAKTQKPRAGQRPLAAGAEKRPLALGPEKHALALGEALAAAGDEAAALLKAGEEPGIAKAAKFLLLLGTDQASKVLGHLSPAEIEAVSKEILKVDSIDAVQANEVLAEFGWLVKTKGWSIEGGPETAQKMLTAAFGEERALALMRKAAPESQRPFKFMDDYDGRQLHLILKDESPQVLSVIVPYLDPKKASALIELLQPELRVELVKRIAKLEKVNPEVIRGVEEGMRERIRKVGTMRAEEVDGKAALAGILRHVDTRLEEQVLDALDEESPELSKNVRERLFTIEDIMRVPDRAMQSALRDFQDRDIALALKGRDERFKSKLLGNVSANRRAMIQDEYSILGPVRREDAEEAARELLAYFKRAWEDGDISLDGDDDLVS